MYCLCSVTEVLPFLNKSYADGYSFTKMKRNLTFFIPIIGFGFQCSLVHCKTDKQSEMKFKRIFQGGTDNFFDKILPKITSFRNPYFPTNKEQVKANCFFGNKGQNIYLQSICKPIWFLRCWCGYFSNQSRNIFGKWLLLPRCLRFTRAGNLCSSLYSEFFGLTFVFQCHLKKSTIAT